MFEDEAPRPAPGAIRPGEDLTAMSVDDLRARVSVMKAEIERAEAMIASKTDHAAAADAVFRT